MSDPKPCFTDELMLAGWSETSAGGAKVTFFLPDAAALDVFRQMTVKKGNTAGQRFACVLVEIGDEEQPVAPPANPEAPAVKGIPVSEQPQEWGHYYTALYKNGWFNSAAVQEKFGDAKQHFYDAFGVDSLKNIEPSAFRDYVEKHGLLYTLPALFKGLRQAVAA